MLLWISKTSRRVIGNRNGAAAMEFALIAPVAFSMMLGIVEYGFVFYGYSAMQLGANRVARAVAVNTLDIDAAPTSVNTFLPRWMPAATVTAWRGNAADPSRSTVEIRVAAPAGSTTPIHIFTQAFPFTLTSSVAVKQELPFENVEN